MEELKKENDAEEEEEEENDEKGKRIGAGKLGSMDHQGKDSLLLPASGIEFLLKSL